MVPGWLTPRAGRPVDAAVLDVPRVARRAHLNLPKLSQELGTRIVGVWIPRVAWSLSRTGKSGLVGLALVGASAVFFLSTQLPITDEVSQLREDLASAKAHASVAPRLGSMSGPQTLGTLPARGQMPQLLGILLQQAEAAQLSIETAKYETSSVKSGTLVRYRVAFPVEGSYPQVREFVDAVLKAMPALAIDQLSITRKAIGDATVEAQIRMTIFTRSGP
jgi:hypothetical protein